MTISDPHHDDDPTIRTAHEPNCDDIRHMKTAALWCAAGAAFLGSTMVIQTFDDVRGRWPIFNSGLAILIVAAVLLAVAASLHGHGRSVELATRTAAAQERAADTLDKILQAIHTETGETRSDLARLAETISVYAEQVELANRDMRGQYDESALHLRRVVLAVREIANRKVAGRIGTVLDSTPTGGSPIYTG